MKPIPDAIFLGGKVLKRSLPVVQPPTGPEAPTLKRLLLPQGELAQFYDAEDGVRYMAFIELCAGSVRGNHYHELKEEWVYLIRGEVDLVVQELSTEAREIIPMQAGDLARISTRVAHALRTIVPGQAVEFSQQRFHQGDIHRFALA